MEITTIHIAQQLPEVGFVRLHQILGRKANPKSKPPKPAIPPLIPVGKSTWWAGVASGRYPRAYKISGRATGWKIEDIRSLLMKLASEQGAR